MLSCPGFSRPHINKMLYRLSANTSICKTWNVIMHGLDGVPSCLELFHSFNQLSKKLWVAWLPSPCLSNIWADWGHIQDFVPTIVVSSWCDLGGMDSSKFQNFDDNNNKDDSDWVMRVDFSVVVVGRHPTYSLLPRKSLSCVSTKDWGFSTNSNKVILYTGFSTNATTEAPFIVYLVYGQACAHAVPAEL